MADRFDGEWQVYGPAGTHYASYFQPQANLASATLAADGTSLTLRYLDGTSIVYGGVSLGYDGVTLSGSASSVVLRSAADALLARLSSTASNPFLADGGLAVHGGSALFARLLSGDNLVIGSTQGRAGALEQLHGGTGHDTYRPGNGFTSISDSGGVSRLDLSQISGPTTVNLQAQTFTLGGGTGAMSGVTEIIGSAAGDVISAGTDASFVIATGAGDDVIEAFGGTLYGARFTLDAGADDDTVTINQLGYGMLQGGAGQDTLRAGGDIRFYGFSGFETLANTYFLRVRTEQLREVAHLTNLNPFNSNQVEVELHGAGTVDFHRLMTTGVTVNARVLSADTHVIGSDGDDRFADESSDIVDGFPLPSTFHGGGGNDLMFNNSGLAIFEFSGRMADYTITRAPGLGADYIVTDNRPGSPDGADTIVGVNLAQPILRFSDYLASVNEQVAYKADATRLPAQIYNGRLQLFGPDNFDYAGMFPARAWAASEALSAGGASYAVSYTNGIRIVFTGTGLSSSAAFTPSGGSVDRIEVFDTSLPGAPLLLARFFDDPSSGHLMRVPFKPELLHGGPAVYQLLMSGNNHIDGSPNDDTLAADIGRNTFFGGAGFHTLSLGRNVDSYTYQTATGGGYTQVDYVDGYDQMQTFADALEDPIPGEHPAPAVLNAIVSYWQDVVNSGGQIPPLPLFILRLIEAFGGGDPHITTLDGVGYSFHALGEFVLTRSTTPGDNFQIQMRTIPFVGLATVIGQTATQVGSDRVSFDAGRADPVRINGLRADFSGGVLALSGGTLTELQPGQWRLDYANGDRLNVTLVDTGTDYLSVTFAPGPARPLGSLQGVWGNYDGDRLNDFQTADGSVIARPLSASVMYGAFADAWRVSPANSLLDYGTGESTGTYTRRVEAPAFSLRDLPPEVASTVDAIVRAAGITDPILRDFAAYDYLLTGDTRSITQLAAHSQAGLAAVDREESAGAATETMLGVVVEQAAVRAEPAGSATRIGFQVYRVGPVVDDAVLQWAVVDPGEGWFDASIFPGGTLPSGQVTIPKLSTTASFQVTLPPGAVTAATELLRVVVSSPLGVPVVGGQAQVEVVNHDPVAGPTADAAFVKLAGLGSLTRQGNDWVLDLGALDRGATITPIRLGLTNIGPVNGNDISGSFAATGALAGFSGIDPVLRLQAGDLKGGIVATIDTTVPGAQTSVLTFSATQGNDSGYRGSLPAETLTLRATVGTVWQGGTGNDSLVGTAAADVMAGAGGDDTLVGLGGNDRLRGDEGNDRLDGGAGIDIADYRGAVAVTVDLPSGIARQGTDQDTLIAIEALFGSSAGDTIRLLDGAPQMPGETVRGGLGNDTIDGGSGIDLAEFSGSRAAYTIMHQAGTLNLTVSGPDGTDSLSDVELLLFADRVVAFGPRMEELARVAFALWTPPIVGSPTLFARGISFYTNEFGYSLDTLCQVALQYFPEGGAATAARLKASIPGIAYTAQQLIDLMAADGGIDSTSGRAAAVKAVALDPATTAQLELAGVFANGVVATLGFPGETADYFGPLPG